MRVSAGSCISIPSVALAATIVWGAAGRGAEAADSIEMKTGFAEILRLNRTIHTIVIGDPRIVDATIGSGQTIVLTAKRKGATNLIVLDESGSEISSATINVVGSEVEQRPGGVAQREQIIIRRGHSGWRYVCAPGCEFVRRFDDRSTAARGASDLGASAPPRAPSNEGVREQGVRDEDASREAPGADNIAR